jgi:membrane protease YdiL (CAAX protease family)
MLQYTVEINVALDIGKYFPDVENWMREMQDKNDYIITQFMTTVSPMGLLVNLIVVAVLPAVGEELLFRGVLMNWLSKVMSNIHINILISAAIFSAIHFQFYGFIPRFMLGIILGYAYYFSQNLWVPMLLHFINNAITVIIYYWINVNNLEVNPEDFGSVDSKLYVVISGVFMLLILLQMNRTKAGPEGVPS